MAMKKKITIIIAVIISVLIILFCMLGYLYLTTDFMKSTEKLFAKYFMENTKIFNYINQDMMNDFDDMLNESKYTSKKIGKIEYVENKETSDENRDNIINKISLKVDTQEDKSNNYLYRDIEVMHREEKIAGFEYLKEGKNAVRFEGVKQFVVTDDDEESILGFTINGIENILKESDIYEITKFTEEEQKSLAEKYLKTIKDNVSSSKYNKKANTEIMLDNTKVYGNEYYITLTVEEYNELYIKILEQLRDDDIIISKIDLIEKVLERKRIRNNDQEKIKSIFIEKINNVIENIKDTNIGNEEVKISVYEYKKNLVKTSIKKSEKETNLIFVDDNNVEINILESTTTENEKTIRIEKGNRETEKEIYVKYKNLKDNNLINNINIELTQSLQDATINKNIKANFINSKYEATFNIEDNIKLVSEFENIKSVGDDAIDLDNTEEDIKAAIKNALEENIKQQLEKINSIVNVIEYKNMLKKLQIINNSGMQLPTEREVTEIEKRRYNAQFEFFVSENLTKANIEELVDSIKNHFGDLKVLFKDGNLDELDIERISSYKEEDRKYQENIKELIITIKENRTNQEKIDDILTFIEKRGSQEYTVALEYDNNGLVNMIRIKIQED